MLLTRPINTSKDGALSNGFTIHNRPSKSKWNLELEEIEPFATFPPCIVLELEGTSFLSVTEHVGSGMCKIC